MKHTLASLLLMVLPLTAFAQIAPIDEPGLQRLSALVAVKVAHDKHNGDPYNMLFMSRGLKIYQTLKQLNDPASKEITVFLKKRIPVTYIRVAPGKVKNSDGFEKLAVSRFNSAGQSEIVFNRELFTADRKTQNVIILQNYLSVSDDTADISYSRAMKYAELIQNIQ